MNFQRVSLNFILILPVMFFSCNSSKNPETVITGQFMEHIPEEITFTTPVNGTAFAGFFNRISPDSLGGFNILVNIPRPAFVNFSYETPCLIIEPGKQYRIILQADPRKGSFTLAGDLSIAQQFYNGLPHLNPMFCIYEYGEDIVHYSNISHKLCDALQKESDAICDLFRQGHLSEDLRDLLLTDRIIYYNLARAVLASRNHLEMRRNELPLPADLFEMWGEAISAVPLNDRFLLHSLYSYDYLLMHFWFRIYTEFDYDQFVELRNQKRDQGLTHRHNLQLAENFFQDEVLEFFTAGSFYYQHMRRQYDQDQQLILDQFKSKFPASNYTSFVEATFALMTGTRQ